MSQGYIIYTLFYFSFMQEDIFNTHKNKITKIWVSKVLVQRTRGVVLGVILEPKT